MEGRFSMVTRVGFFAELHLSCGIGENWRMHTFCKRKSDINWSVFDCLLE